MNARCVIIITISLAGAALPNSLANSDTNLLPIPTKLTMYQLPKGQKTASTKPLKPGYHAAVSRTLERKLPLGSRVYIPGHPSKSKDLCWEVTDRTHHKFKDDRLDLSKLKTDKKFSTFSVVYLKRVN